MKALWTDAGNDPNWALTDFTHFYLPLNDPLPDVKRRLEQSLVYGFGVGVYACWNWGPFLETDGKAFAEWADERLKALVSLGFVMTPSRPKVQLNNERHEPAVILAMLKRWREIRSKQDTSWTLEGGQGGWMTPEFVSEVVSRKVRVAPQLYNGAMTEAWDSLTYSRDLTKRGIPDSLISPVYDAKHLQRGWAGWAFTQGRLPA